MLRNAELALEEWSRKHPRWSFIASLLGALLIRLLKD
jgi:hypothetical protein